MREKGIAEKRIQQQIQLFSGSSQKTTKDEEDKTLTVIFENRVAYRWLVSHPLIWSYENDADGMRILTGLDYDRVQKIFDIEGFDTEELKEVITAVSDDSDVSENGNNDTNLQRDLFSRLMQIEIGAKAFFDYRVNKQREENERKLKNRR